MTNKKRGEVEIYLAGDTHTLLLDMNAICTLEEAFDGKSIDQLLFSGNFSRLVLRQAIYVGMIRYYGSQKKVTPEIVGEMMAETFAEKPDSMKDLVMPVLEGVLAGNGADTEEINNVLKMTEAQLTGSKYGKGGKQSPLSQKGGGETSATIGTN